MAWAPDGSNRLFVTHKSGAVRIVQNGALLAAPFATVSPVYTGSECGVLGTCFDPDFINNRYVYFFVTVSGSEQQIIRYIDSTNSGTNKTTIVSRLPTRGGNHDSGAIGFGPDGKLYWAIGDIGDKTGIDDDLSSLACKVGRANRDGTPCDDNPYSDGTGPNNDYIWARGFRNPFTLTFAPGTGKLWLNVVGSGYEQVFVTGRGDHGGWDNYENNQPAVYLAPVISWRTNNSLTATVVSSTGAVRSNNVVTITKTSSTPQFRPGAKVTVTGVNDSSFNGTFYVLSRPNNTQFTVDQNGPNATSGSGTVTAANIGGCITGGCFYNGTAFPAEYRGNFFAGDYNSGNIIRAITGTDSLVTSVDIFVTASSTHIDMETGPDGALYYAGHNGTIRRLAYSGSSAQNLIVQPTHLNVMEGGSTVMTVRLANAPPSNVSVSVTRTAGDPDLAVAAGATLTFTPANWSQLQTVRISGAEDADKSGDEAIFRVSSSGLTGYDASVHGIDNDESNFVLSREIVKLNENSSGTFTIALASPPAGALTVSTARSSGDSDITVPGGATLNFTAANYATPQTVTVAAAADADAASDTATLSIMAPGEPARTVTVNVTDDTASAPTITSSPVTSTVVNAPYAYDVNATGAPAPTFSLTTAPGGMTVNSSTGVMQWTPPAAGSFPVTVRATNSVSPDAVQSFSITVNADAAPSAVITQPASGAVVSGATAEFFGNGVDDVGCVKAEFYVDGVLQYTDINNGGHYHYGGGHALFDTTQYADGSHTLRMTVTDTTSKTGSQEVVVSVQNGAPPSNEAPTISVLANRTFSEDSTTGSLTFTVGDAETPPSNLTVTGVSSNPTLVPNANLVLGGSGAGRTVTVTPSANEHGTGTISLSVSDGSLSTTSSFVVTVSAINDLPASAAQSVTVQENGSIEVTLSGSDVDGDALNYSLVNSPVSGVLSGSLPNTVYTPAPDFHGSDSFTFTVSDGVSVSAPATVSVAVTPAAGAWEVVALSGDAAPEAGGALYATFPSGVRSDRDGDAVFRGEVNAPAGTSGGVWAESNGALQLVARQGSAAPGVTGGLFDAFSTSPWWSGSGHLLLYSKLQTGPGGITSSNDYGFWYQSPSGPLQLVAREYNQAAGLAAGVLFLQFGSAVLSDDGLYAFTATLKTNGSLGITTSNDSGIWTNFSGASAPLVREGQVAPGTANGQFNALTSALISANSSGQLAFRSVLQIINGVTDANKYGIWMWDGTQLAKIARGGDPAPGTPPGAVFLKPAAPLLRDTMLLFHANLANDGGVTSGDDSGIWILENGTVSLLARENSAAPGAPTGAVFTSLPVAIAGNDRGDIIYKAPLRGAGGISSSNNDGIWARSVATGNAFTLIAREGTHAPQSPSGAVFATFDTAIVTGGGREAFTANLLTGPGGVTTANDRGLWMRAANGQIALALREGDTIPVSQTDLREVADIALDNSSETGAAGFSNANSIQICVTFRDGSTALLSFDAP